MTNHTLNNSVLDSTGDLNGAITANSLTGTFGVLLTVALVLAGLMAMLALAGRLEHFQLVRTIIAKAKRILDLAAKGLAGATPLALGGAIAYQAVTAEPTTQATVGKWAAIGLTAVLGLAAFGLLVEKWLTRFQANLATINTEDPEPEGSEKTGGSGL